MNTNDLPNDIDSLKKFILNLNKENDKKDQLLQNKERLLENKDQQIETLKETILLLRRRSFAPSSEKDPNQLTFNELEDIVINTPVEEEEELIEVPAHKKKRGKRKAISDSLPRVEDIFDLSDEEKIGMKLIGEEISEKLEIAPAKVFVRKIIRKKYAPVNGEGKVVVAKGDEELLPKAMAGASMIAYIIIAKYADALPLYRQETIFKRLMTNVTRQTMGRWLVQVAQKLLPLYNLLQDHLLDSNYIQMDETITQVLKEDGKKATTKSYMWVRYSGGDSPIVLYDYDPTRKGDVPLELLNGFKGYLQCDGYDGYNKACVKYKLTRVGCWDHCRRKFVEASKTTSGKSIGKQGINKIKKLYKIEEQIKNLSLGEKYRIRQEKSKVLLDEFKVWIDELRNKVVPTSRAGKAINYAFNEWEYLVEYINAGEVNISNTQVENAIRPFAIGRKNWLFSSSVEGAQASAMYYSLIETAKKNGLEPFDYFNKMLDKLPAAKTVEDYESLLPFKSQFLVK